MGWLEFIASMTKSLAWPLVVILIFILFRKEIKERIRDILKLSLPGVAAEFDKKADEVKSSLVNASSPLGGVLVAAPEAIAFEIRESQDEEIESFANVGRIVSAWSKIENIVKRRLQAVNVDVTRLGPSQLLLAAKTQNLITRDQFDSLRGLLAMRNLAAHGRADEITNNRVSEFLVLANAIMTLLDITPPPSDA